jgi:hypothetical protein
MSLVAVSRGPECPMRRVRKRSLATTCRATFGCGSTYATTLLYPLRRASVTEYDRFEYGGLPDRLRTVLCHSRFDYLAIADEFLGRLYVSRAGLAEGGVGRNPKVATKPATVPVKLRAKHILEICRGDDSLRVAIPQ